jgi:hypothetical protein
MQSSGRAVCAKPLKVLTVNARMANDRHPRNTAMTPHDRSSQAATIKRIFCGTAFVDEDSTELCDECL